MVSVAKQETEAFKRAVDEMEDPVTESIGGPGRRMIELEDFREKLERIQEGKDREARIHVRWKSKEEQPKGWRADINDGVKINIAPWERLGMFPVKKIVGKVEMGELNHGGHTTIGQEALAAVQEAA